MFKKEDVINEIFLFVCAVVGLIAGIIAIAKDTTWYISLVIFLVSIFLFLLHFLKKNKYSDFEILSRNEIIDLIDSNGKMAHYSNECIFKSLKNNAQSIKFLINSSGKLKNPEINPGIIEKKTEEAGTTIFEVCSPKPIKKNETFTSVFKCVMINTFRKDNEYWEVNKFSKGLNVSLTIIFPDDRKPIVYKAFKIDGHNKIYSIEQPKLIIVKKRPALLFEVKQMTHFEKYRIEWKW